MQLIYNANIINHTPKPLAAYIKPRALNWRFHAPGETYNTPTALEAYIKPRALNWRFKTTAWTENSQSSNPDLSVSW
jgi:hypothetical protein